MKSTIDILRHARSTYDRTAAADRLLELGYSPERAARACSLYPQGQSNDSLTELIGKTLKSITKRANGRSSDVDDEIVFVATTGERWRMWYQPDCCAVAWIEDINGDLDDLVGSPIVMAEAVTDTKTPPVNDEYSSDSYTWTFYKLATVKGYVTIRWYGSSNGYYSETASFARVPT